MSLKKVWVVGLLLVLILVTGSGVLAEENLIVNGGFEQQNPEGQLEGWTEDFWQAVSSMKGVTSKVHSGKSALEIKSDKTNDARMVQTITVKPNTFYKLSGWIATENIASEKAGANLCLMGGYDYTPTLKGTTDWTFVEFNFRTHSSQTAVTIGARLGMYNEDNTGTAYFDDLSLTELSSQPASFVQLGGPAGENSAQAAPVKKVSGGMLIWIVLIIVTVANIWFFKKSKK